MRRCNWPQTLGERPTTSCRNLVSKPTLIYWLQTLLPSASSGYTMGRLSFTQFLTCVIGIPTQCSISVHRLPSDFEAFSLVVITDETNMLLSALICSPLLILSLSAFDHRDCFTPCYKRGFIHISKWHYMSLPRDILPRAFFVGGGGILFLL